MISNKPGVQPGRAPELDGLRAVAIMLVISFHSWFFLQYAMESQQVFLDYSDALPRLLGFVRRGDVGVDIFFVLSGFLLSRQLFWERNATGHLKMMRFYAHRIFRIYPLYLVALLIAGLTGNWSWAMLGNIFAYNIWFDPEQIVIPWTWSLSVELEFYAIVPLLVLAAATRNAAALITVGICALTIVWSVAGLAAYPEIGQHSLIDFEISGQREHLMRYFQTFYVAMPARIGQFILGFAAAWTVVYRADILGKMSVRVRTLLIAIALGGFIIPSLYNPYGHLESTDQPMLVLDLLFGRISFALSAAILILLMNLRFLPILTRLLSAKILQPVARFSFSMYLFHPLFVYLGIAIFVGSDPVSTVSALQYVAVFGCALGGSMLFGAGTWYALERPAIRFGRRRFD